VLTVSVEVATAPLEAVTVAGFRLQVTPVVAPVEHDRLTGLENPPKEVTETVELEEKPAV
jgi:hypothetical protein